MGNVISYAKNRHRGDALDTDAKPSKEIDMPMSQPLRYEESNVFDNARAKVSKDLSVLREVLGISTKRDGKNKQDDKKKASAEKIDNPKGANSD